MAKTISIITPVFNRADCILNCLESVSKQRVPDGWQIEHVVQDDGSFDGTPSIIETFASFRPNVLYSRFDKNRGTNAARNAAIGRATGEWITFLDSDDVMLPSAIDRICHEIERNEDFSHIVFATESSGIFNVDSKKVALSFEDFLTERVMGDFVHVFLRSTAIKYKFHEDLRIFEGINFLRLFKEVGKVLYIPEQIYKIDRNRTDHVTFSLWLTNMHAVRQKIKAHLLKIDLFQQDYDKSEEGRKKLESELDEIYKLCVLSGDYEMADKVKNRMKAKKIPFAFNVLHKGRLGSVAWFFARNILHLKHWLRRK